MAVGSEGVPRTKVKNRTLKNEGCGIQRGKSGQGQSLRSRKPGDDLSYTGRVNPGFVAAKWPTAGARRVVVVIGYAS